VSIESSDRSKFFPAIEKKYGLPITYWFDQLKKISDKKYPEQMAFLIEGHGMSRNHAHALVMYSRGSKSAQRFNTLSEYLKTIDKSQAKTVKAIFSAVKDKYPKAEIVIAWNHPLVRYKEKYIFGVSASKNHLLLGPWNPKTLDQFNRELSKFKTNKKTIQLPNDWIVEKKLILDIFKFNA
jgi:uncharacterized protein YdhG (YjbR/CyaY superfamily)